MRNAFKWTDHISSEKWTTAGGGTGPRKMRLPQGRWKEDQGFHLRPWMGPFFQELITLVAPSSDSWPLKSIPAAHTDLRSVIACALYLLQGKQRDQTIFPRPQPPSQQLILMPPLCPFPWLQTSTQPWSGYQAAPSTELTIFCSRPSCPVFPDPIRQSTTLFPQPCPALSALLQGWLCT